MFSNKFSNLLNATSALTLASILLGPLLISPTQAMEPEEKKVHASTMAPFSTKDVVAHAASYPENYEIKYLQSKRGLKHIEKVINDINKGQWPQKNSIEGAWHRTRLNAGYNKSLIADHVSNEYRCYQLFSPDEKIIKTLQLKNLIKENIQNYKVIIPKNSSFAEKVIFLKENSCELVAKVFMNPDCYKEEKKKFLLPEASKYVKLTKDLGEQYQKKLPVLMEYKGSSVVEGKGIILLTKGKGKTFTEISEQVDEIPDEKIIKIFKSIGAQIGHLDSLFYLYNDGNLLVHPDPKPGNVTYDEDEDQFYWIDTAGIYLKKKDLILRDLDFVSLLHVAAFDPGMSFGSPAPCENWSEQDAENFHKKAKKHLLAHKSLYEGYAYALIENQLSYTNLFETENFAYRVASKLNDFGPVVRMNKQFLKFGLSPISFENDYEINGISYGLGRN